MLAVELNIIAGISWFGLAANLARFGRSARGAMWGSWMGLVPVNLLPAAAGLASSLTLGSADPVAWMTPLLGPAMGLAMLLILLLANLSSIVAMLQGNMHTVLQNFGRPFQRLGFARTVLLFVVAAGAIVLLASDSLYTRFYAVVAFFNAILASCLGVLLADRLVLRRARLCVRALHDAGEGGPYGFWRGLNPAALAAVVLGFLTYLSLLEPLKQLPGPLFGFAGASLPTAAVAFVAHLALTRALVIPAGKGGYPGHRMPAAPAFERR